VILYYNAALDPDRKTQIEIWFASKGVTDIDVQEHSGSFAGSVHFEVTHRGNGKKATVSFG
jgi:hypothetical protein